MVAEYDHEREGLPPHPFARHDRHSTPVLGDRPARTLLASCPGHLYRWSQVCQFAETRYDPVRVLIQQSGAVHSVACRQLQLK